MDDPSPSPIPLSDETPVNKNTASPVLAFIIGLSIILLASVLNAAGLNLTKLDHVRTNAIPKAARRRDWLRPLWLLGMLLYILSQLIGSTLALEYMRAEYVAPLGSSSLIFNFLFARFLVGTPVTSNDIYGTIIVILGVIGIVAFGSINGGLAAETDVVRLTYLWRRGGWLGYFFLMSFALSLVFIFTSSLDAVHTARSDLHAVPFSGVNASRRKNTHDGSFLHKLGRGGRVLLKVCDTWDNLLSRVTAWLEVWSSPKDDKQLAWTLGIGWACCGGGLAGGCLVFAKAIVKLLSGSLSNQNPGNQFGHAAPIFTIILLCVTAVLQITCLNRGLKVYDSTLVVPVFYGVYTATGFLNSLIFNDEVGAYKSWTLFLIFVSILVLICGVVLLTHKKPEPKSSKTQSSAALPRRQAQAHKSKTKLTTMEGDEENEHGEDQILWAVGEVSDAEGEDEDVDHYQNPMHQQEEMQHHNQVRAAKRQAEKVDSSQRRSEEQGLISPERRSRDGA
ncbi:hypothetical protein AGABI1DRAFT_71748 [Agaricus bisporus var. burnettii JB137-S8]|uniref:Uncharacterized protein n=1 Tax=Agaricus bisporus var. burnettii (strain JB137-S8 / ATCC MYA-4627 / FGSC 10392) TaxID=597362 RepID=K5XZW6_AGABU|nr:uncharacterized protein AGABI1DRAFT_71748 [Agaricus bisporus var. burnettii JB137-S8]EKM81025.1 hypothetical protein AGABI1DRAFT_71748 [Agaricus bisporus var. burnettii JB137-S8]